jgi:hypothetical protein
MSLVVKFEVFRSPISSWEKLFEAASLFASKIGKENVINISHSWGVAEGIVTVWHWAERDSNILGIDEEE